MNWFDALLKLMFGGGPKAAPPPAPKPPSARRAPSQPHPHEQNVGAPQEIRLEPAKPAPEPRPQTPPAQPMPPAQREAASVSAAPRVVPTSTAAERLAAEARRAVQPPENRGVAFIPRGEVAMRYLPLDHPWDGKVPENKRIGDFAWENALTDTDFEIIRSNPGANKKDPRNIRLITDWPQRNIDFKVEIPQLRGVKGGMRGSVPFHKKGADQLVALWADWEKAGLLHLIHTFDGAYNPRYQGWKGCWKGVNILDSRKSLSNHSFGTAFDINAEFNPNEPSPFIPPLRGEDGCVRELVAIANEHGFFWGGDFKQSPDGMHFELGRVTGAGA